ncbi:nucleotide exchange factor GrpE [bacterium]|nr:nucleotide exchange factor GrpE [bacterium]
MILDDTTTPPTNQDPAQQTITEPATGAADPNYKDLYLRTNADFQNFKKRTERERSELAQLLQAEAMEQLLPIVDDLERAIAAATANGHNQAWIDGFSLILKNAKKRLSDKGVEEIATAGMFDPALHEALMHVESPEHTSGQIVQVLEKGYTLKGKVLKYARVSVAK